MQVQKASIKTRADNARGGNLTIDVNDFVHFVDSNVQVHAKGSNQDDNGGNIKISNPNFFILQKSSINASADAGNGGNITVDAKNFAVSSGSSLDVSSKLNVPGLVKIDIETELSDNFTTLSYQPLDVTHLLNNRCAGLSQQNLSSFVITTRDVLPPSPTDLKTHLFLLKYHAPAFIF